MGISLSRLWPSPSPVRCIGSACDSHEATLPPKPDSICEGCWTSLLAVGLCDGWIQPIITNGVYCRYKGGRSCCMHRSYLKRSPLDCQCCILVQEALRRADLLAARTSEGLQGDELQEDRTLEDGPLEDGSTVDELFKIAVGLFGPNDIDTVSPPDAQVLGVVINQKLVFVGVVHTSQGQFENFMQRNLILTSWIRRSCSTIYRCKRPTSGRWRSQYTLSREGAHPRVRARTWPLQPDFAVLHRR